MSHSILLLVIVVTLAGCTRDRDGTPSPAHARAGEGARDTAAARADVRGRELVVIGDFDGDGRRDTLAERYLDAESLEPLSLGLAGDPYDSLAARAFRRRPHSLAAPSRPGLDTLWLAKRAPTLGLAYFRNEGDLDDDGRDEIAFVLDNADWSGVNACTVVSLGRGGWQERASFAMREHELFDDDLDSYRELDSFSLITRARRGVIRVRTIAEVDTDSVAVADPVVREIALAPLR